MGRFHFAGANHHHAGPKEPTSSSKSRRARARRDPFDAAPNPRRHPPDGASTALGVRGLVALPPNDTAFQRRVPAPGVFRPGRARGPAWPYWVAVAATGATWANVALMGGGFLANAGAGAGLRCRKPKSAGQLVRVL